MRVPRLRITLWLLMVVVGLTALGSGAWVLRERSRRYRQRALGYAASEGRWLQRIGEDRDRLATIDRRKGDFVREQDKRLEDAEVRYRSIFTTAGEPASNADEFIAEAKRARDRLVEDAIERHVAQADTARRRIAHHEALLAWTRRLRIKYDRAAAHPWLAVRADPPPPDLFLAFEFWLSQYNYQRALAELEKLINERPDSAVWYGQKAWVLATCPQLAFRDGKRAVEVATRACELTEWQELDYLDKLAAAYAAAGDFHAAIRWQTAALDRTPSNWPDRRGYEARLALYRQGTPYREQPKAE